MSKSMLIRLLSTAIIGGLPRSPVEGLQTVDEAEGKRLIAEGIAVDASDSADGDEGSTSDGLERKTKAELQTIAKKEGAAFEGDANKATIIAAIRAKREPIVAGPATEPAVLDGLDEAALREVAEAEGVTLADDADEAGIRDAIIAKRTAV